jgi:hypothetical protein
MTRVGAAITGNLGPAELREGRNQLRVTIDADGDGAIDNQAWSTFSWEPNLDLANADRCDPLDTSLCLYPFPNDHFTTPDPATPTGLRVALHPDSMPRNVGNRPANPAKWNFLDGFSVGAMLLFQGLAIALMAGEVASLLLSRSAVPILYFKLWRHRYATPPSKSPLPPEPIPSHSEHTPV